MPIQKQRSAVEKSGKTMGIVVGLVCLAAGGLLLAGVFTAPDKALRDAASSVGFNKPGEKAIGKGTAEPGKEGTETAEPAKPAPFLAVEDGIVQIKGKPFKVVGATYKYNDEPVQWLFRPATYTDAIRTTIVSDLEKLSKAGANTVEFSVPYKMPDILTDCYLYVPISDTAYSIAAGQALEYQVLFPRGTTSYQGGVDFLLSDNKRLRDLRMRYSRDENPADATADLETVGRSGTWITRRIPLKGLDGKRIIRWYLALEGDKAGPQNVQVRGIKILDLDMGGTPFELYQQQVVRVPHDDKRIVRAGYGDFKIDFVTGDAIRLASTCTGPKDPTKVKGAVVTYDPKGGPEKYLAGVSADLIKAARSNGLQPVVNVLSQGPPDKFSDDGRQKCLTWLKNFCENLADTKDVFAFNVGDGARVIDEDGNVDEAVQKWLQHVIVELEAQRPQSLRCLTLCGQGKKLADVAKECGQKASVIIIQPVALTDDLADNLLAVTKAFMKDKPIWIDFSKVFTADNLADFESFKKKIEKVYTQKDLQKPVQGAILGDLVKMKPLLPESFKLKTFFFKAATETKNKPTPTP